jgi:dTDP-4-amino-4,6-dideoxygalactose transaminase
MVRIPFLKPNLVKKESYIKYLDEIDGNQVYSNYGPLNSLFEKRILKNYFDNEGALTTVNNATSGLMLAINKVKKKGKYALMPSFTFAATPLAAQWCGLEPYFIDINSTDWSMNEQLLEQAILELGDELAIVVPYATFGTVVNLTYYQQLLNRGIPVVVDAAASFGSTQNGLGLQQFFSGLIVYSFHATKSFGIGEGGIVYSQSELIINQIRQAGNFGFDINRESEFLGLNSKLSEYAAAIGLAALAAFPDKIKERRRIISDYTSAIAKSGLLDEDWAFQEISGELVRQTMPLLCPKRLNNKDVVKFLAEKGIESRTYFAPACHQQKQFSLCSKTTMEVTDNIAKRILHLPMWEGMDKTIIQEIVSTLELL